MFGGAGFVGTHLARHLRATNRFGEVVLVDIVEPSAPLPKGVRHVLHDVRVSIPATLTRQPDWIFNLAAVHREPGHAPAEYAATNVPGAHNVTSFAREVGCRHLYFTSSIACYGRLDEPADENTPLRPVSPYGRSKVEAEHIHLAWQQNGPDQRLVVCRAAALYGPGDPGNILRLIRAARRGRLFLGDPDVRKSCGYVHEFLRTVDFALDRRDPFLLYNFADAATHSVGELVEIAAEALGFVTHTVRLPQQLLMLVAHAIHSATLGRSVIHPTRVRKASTPTHVLTTRLRQLGYRFRFDFATALRDWQRRAPADFA
ncbi:MAG: NAD(P)-dependent oxidoreductase [Planctomycetota bacterium]